MALTSINGFSAGFADKVSGPTLWQRFKTGFAAYIRQRARLDQIERLEAMSDAELASHGLSRDRIVTHVFRDTSFV